MELPNLNDLIEEALRHRRSYAKFKQGWQGDISTLIKSQKLKPMNKARIDFIWIERSRKRDPDNIAAGGRKLILDALVESGIIANDGWKHIVGFIDHFSINKSEPGVIIHLDDLEDLQYSKNDAMPKGY